MSSRALYSALATVALGTSVPTHANNDWRFAVSLEGRPIGYHRFSIREQDGVQVLTSEARFNVTFLFFNAYRYVHDANEIWQSDCLKQLTARTDDNGRLHAVQGEQQSDRFTFIDKQEMPIARTCIQTFAYWNPRILSADRLLNPQTGEYVPVTIERIGSESLSLNSQSSDAIRYRIKGRSSNTPLQIDVWYSPDGEWLGLESLAEGGRRLKYTLQ